MCLILQEKYFYFRRAGMNVKVTMQILSVFS